MIGQTVYVFDINRRVYRQQKGLGSGGPIWREHYRPEIVESETSRSWVTKYGTKVPKKGRNPASIAISTEEIDALEWVHEHRYKIVRLLEQCHEPEKIRAIAAILEFQSDAASHGQGEKK
jgi:hypothetical protein